MSVSSGKRPASFLTDGEAPESEDPLPSIARKQKRAVWSVDDLKILQEAKRHDQEKFLRGGRKEKQKSSAERWAKIAVVCAKEGVRRTPGQCKQKWENLAVDWNKITDYNRSCRKGMAAYWQMTVEERKTKGLPPSFCRDLFNLIEVWYPKCRAANLDPRLISDISGTAISTSTSSADKEEAMQPDSDLISRPPLELLQGHSGIAAREIPHPQMYAIEHRTPSLPSIALDYAAVDNPINNGTSHYDIRKTGQDGNQVAQPLAKRMKRLAWTVDDLLILQAARREGKEISSRTDAHRTVQERWSAMASYCAASGLERAPESCRQKWEQMATDWKKINDYQKSLVAGAPPYWELSGDDRKALKLPFSFARELFNAIESWYPRNKISGPDKATVDMNLRALAVEQAVVESDIERERAGLSSGLVALLPPKASYVTVDTTMRAIDSAPQSHPSLATRAPAQGSVSATATPSASAQQGAPAVAMQSSWSGRELGPAMFPKPAAGGTGTAEGISAPSAGPEVDWHFLRSCINGISGQLQRMASHPADREQMGQAMQELESRFMHRFADLEISLKGKVDSMLAIVGALTATVDNLATRFDILAETVDTLSGSVQTVARSVDTMGVERDIRLADAVVQLKKSIAAIEERGWARSINTCSSKLEDRVEPIADQNLNVPDNFPNRVEDLLNMSEADSNRLLEVYGLSKEGSIFLRKLRLANYFGLRISFH